MLVLDTRGYDMILGMTWLSRYHAVIDCRNNYFQNTASAWIQFDEKHKFAKRKTQSVCALAEIKKKEVLVWNKFSDVFKEMLGLTPNRAVGFSIDTIPGIVQISKVPYRMAPTKLEILKKQL